MTSINISLKKEAYDFLNSLREGEKSFSEVVLEIKKDKNIKRTNGKALIEFANKARGLNINWDETQRKAREFRESFDRELSERTKR